MLVVWGPLNGLLVLTPSATEGRYPALQATLGLTLTFVGYMAWMLFFYLFPSGHFVPRWTRWLALLYWVRFFGSMDLHTFRPAQLAAPPLQCGPAGSVVQLPGGPTLPLRVRLRCDPAPADQMGGFRGGHSDSGHLDDYLYRGSSDRPPTQKTWDRRC